jgi:TonB-linked SusC/RagA family outer membrane protein
LVAVAEILGTYSENTLFTATAVGDSRIRVPGVAGEPIDVGGGKTHSRLVGGLFVAKYNYKGKYLLKATFRRDGSSRFGPNSKYANFWSLGGAWNITDEKWFDNPSLDFISGLKLRASYGTQGNQNGVGDFPWQATFALGGGYAGTPGYSVTRIENPGFTWEKQITRDVGIDFGFFRNRIQGTIDWYNKETDNLFFPTQVTRTSGFGTVQSNVGSIRNRGIELQLTGSILRKNNIDWTVTLTYAHNRNEVLRVDQGRPIDGTISTIREGSSVNSFYMVRYAGVNAANGDPLYLDAEGNVTTTFADANRVVIGESVPPVNGGIDNTVRVTLPGDMGRIDLSAFLVFVDGVDRLNNVRFFTENRNFGQFNQTRAVLNAWRQPGNVTAIPRYEAGLTQFDSRLLEDASYVRLRNVVIGYTLPGSLTKKIKLNNVRVYAQGQNLFTWTEFTNFDPENRSGVDVFQYPVPRAYTFGVQVQF